MRWPVNPLEGKTTNWRAVCGRPACTVRREGGPTQSVLPTPIRNRGVRGGARSLGRRQLNSGMLDGSPTRMKKRAKAWEKCSRNGDLSRHRGPIRVTWPMNPERFHARPSCSGKRRDWPRPRRWPVTWIGTERWGGAGADRGSRSDFETPHRTPRRPTEGIAAPPRNAPSSALRAPPPRGEAGAVVLAADSPNVRAAPRRRDGPVRVGPSMP
jgi:hypothetical protein